MAAAVADNKGEVDEDTYVGEDILSKELVGFMSFNGTIYGIRLLPIRMGRRGGRRSYNQRTHPRQLDK